MTFGEFIQANGITATARYIGKEEHMHRYAVTLQQGSRRCEVLSYGCGEGIIWHWAQQTSAVIREGKWVDIGGERIRAAQQIKGCRLNTIAAQAFMKVIAPQYVPAVENVLECLTSDAQSGQNAESFEDWASEYGYDEDSRKAEKMYQACVDTALQLQRWLGIALYQELLQCEEA